MHTRRIGDVEVGGIGRGAMRVSIEGRPGEVRSPATVHAAPDAGVTLIGAADACRREDPAPSAEGDAEPDAA